MARVLVKCLKESCWAEAMPGMQYCDAHWELEPGAKSIGKLAVRTEHATQELHLAEVGDLRLSDATTRDFFAGMALQRMLAMPLPKVTEWREELAENSYKFADIMMAERAKRNANP